MGDPHPPLLPRPLLFEKLETSHPRSTSPPPAPPTSLSYVRHGSPAGLEDFLAKKREAALVRRARLPLVGMEGDMGWEGAAAAAAVEEGWGGDGEGDNRGLVQPWG
jgi:hypothetical protein